MTIDTLYHYISERAEILDGVHTFRWLAIRVLQRPRDLDLGGTGVEGDLRRVALGTPAGVLRRAPNNGRGPKEGSFVVHAELLLLGWGPCSVGLEEGAGARDG